jgi:hypothetical protein
MEIYSYKNAHAFIKMIKKSDSIEAVSSFCDVLTIINEYNELENKKEILMEKLRSKQLCIPNAIFQGYELREEEVIFCLEKAKSRLKKLKDNNGSETDDK